MIVASVKKINATRLNNTSEAQRDNLRILLLRCLLYDIQALVDHTDMMQLMIAANRISSHIATALVYGCKRKSPISYGSPYVTCQCQSNTASKTFTSQSIRMSSLPRKIGRKPTFFRQNTSKWKCHIRYIGRRTSLKYHPKTLSPQDHSVGELNRNQTPHWRLVAKVETDIPRPFTKYSFTTTFIA